MEKETIIWHNIKENPKDMPPRCNKDSEFSDNLLTDKGEAYYKFKEKEWYIERWNTTTDDITVWAEMPKYNQKTCEEELKEAKKIIGDFCKCYKDCAQDCYSKQFQTLLKKAKKFINYREV